jgi:YaiO family outer membrane protein
MTELLLTALLAQVPASSPYLADFRENSVPGQQAVVELEHSRDSLDGDPQMWMATRLSGSIQVRPGAWLRLDVSEVEKYGVGGWGTGLSADIRVREDLRVIVGASLGSPKVLATATASTDLVWSGFRAWPGLLLTGGTNYTTFGKGGGVALNGGVVQYTGPFRFSYQVQRTHGFPGDTVSYSQGAGVALTFTAPLRMELGLSGSLSHDAYMALWVDPPPLIELDGFTVEANTRVWLTDAINLHAGLLRGEQRWMDGRTALARWSGLLALQVAFGP